MLKLGLQTRNEKKYRERDGDTDLPRDETKVAYIGQVLSHWFGLGLGLGCTKV